MSRRHAPVALDPADVQVETRGTIPAGAVDEARQTIAQLATITHEPVLYARVRLSVSADPAATNPCTAQANLDVNGQLVRAQAVADSVHEAIRLLDTRLRVRLRRFARDWEEIRGRHPEEARHEWRHGSLPRPSLPYFPRPPGERQIVRHKAYELAWAAPEEAAFDMEQLDYDFHLFTDAETGQDSVIYRDGDGFRMSLLTPAPPRPGPVAIPLTVSTTPAPALTVPEAVERLELIRMPFVFFANADTGRGNILYHRYDGHYGLITPSGE